ncbi:bifunctional diaminohydroxyphosphoribosylaminopyrimidine deaminase/5-amino-6-(5-phosphoribosylamino)uracil reductase RibD [Clostridium sp. MSJ-8]|uniref:bifunctional diaminohydroxyphosphoribosylaminopyrimidine deaminase/5-amino-6-(5-phosphoribosylamino)uracil reductase RibD n=1 Tax=Clostridium sp. MSJ-8 TaxID=2841510 RepID=UPI001C0F003C|nr:bifunctional diaminohydroxyphosphoribosylaminopyrimidine deaminase/5-amino-6-(5-phosphoribosylamino)uracil reductase RibD [Clostridium sp. MSJ-8]MBU5488262.1 bifunctional diaminohydroxyphosphoribosylaminopyrimidine deaminase/5-amino-6-(5-phosphoribosylamino)uracil reductase RibD [Clostridium sp. MSJ-8]
MDKIYMKRALELAALGRGKVAPNPMVGAIIVKEDKIIGEGYHKKYGDNHAEVNAVENATEDVRGATMYVTLEPCAHYGKTPPCAKRIVEEGIKKVVIGVLDPNPLVAGKGVNILKDAGIEVVVGVLEEECRKINEIFMKYIETSRPFVLMKYAMSLDGKISTATGKSKWISCEESRKDVHKLRNNLSAIMVGINTVIKDNPMLNCRIEGGNDPIRIIVDSNLRIPLDSKIVNTSNNISTIVATTHKADKDKIKLLEERNVEVIVAKEKDGRVDITSLIDKLGEKKIDSILLEGGSEINFSCLQEGIVDKVRIYIAPKILGGNNAKGAVGGRGVSEMIESFNIENIDISTIGSDIVVEGYVK